MATVREIAEARLENVDAAIRAAKDTGLPLHVAFALLDMESEGRNFFGSDAGGMYKGQTVTKEKFEKMEAAVAAGKPSNGVGPTQVTHRSFFPQARAKGLKLWEPYDNMVFGFGLLAGYLKRYPGDYQKVGRLYNGKDSYGITFKRVVGEWQARLKGADEEETPVANWFPAPSLIKLRDEVDAAFPGRSKKSDGLFGDAAHSSRYSEHNPHTKDSTDVPIGAVTAIDITATDNKIRDAVMKAAHKEPRVWYYISEGYIYSRTHNWEKRKYTGSNPHNDHVHISLVQTKAAVNSKASWGISKGTTPSEPTAPPSTGTKKLPTLSRGDSDKTLVPFLKRFFGLKAHTDDPLFGSGLRSKVMVYQGKQGLAADGVVGPNTWRKIVSGGTKLPTGYSL